MKRAPAVSVVMPTRGRPKTLRLALSALGSEAGASDAEVIVVHDGEAPDPALAAAFPFATFLSTDRRSGPAAARNLGAARASGELLVFLDDDVEPAPGSLAVLARAHRARPESALTARIEPAATVRPNAYVRIAYAGLAHGGRPASGREMEFAYFCTSFAAVPRRPFVESGGFDTSFDLPGFEDVELAYRLHRHGVPFATSPDAVGLHHRQMDRSWFLNRCRSNGALLRKLHGLHPVTVDLLPMAPPWARCLLPLLGRTWPLWGGLLPAAEVLPWTFAHPILRLAHQAGAARSYRAGGKSG